jgi:hypothetical protein
MIDFYDDDDFYDEGFNDDYYDDDDWYGDDIYD